MKNLELEKLEKDLNSIFRHCSQVQERELYRSFPKFFKYGVIPGNQCPEEYFFGTYPNVEVKSKRRGTIQVWEWEISIAEHYRFGGDLSDKGDSIFTFSLEKKPFRVNVYTIEGEREIARFDNREDAIDYCVGQVKGLELFEENDLSHNNYIQFLAYDKEQHLDENDDPIDVNPIYSTKMYWAEWAK